MIKKLIIDEKEYIGDYDDQSKTFIGKNIDAIGIDKKIGKYIMAKNMSDVQEYDISLGQLQDLNTEEMTIYNDLDNIMANAKANIMRYCENMYFDMLRRQKYNSRKKNGINN